MKEKNNNKGLYIVVAFLCVSVIALSIAYAALSTSLNINFGTVTQSQQSWNVSFVGSQVSGTATGSSQTGLSCGDASITADTVTIANSSISKPGDKCVWPLSVINNGTINANLQTITPKAPNGISCTNSGASMVCGNITYRLVTNTSTNDLLTTNTALNSTDTINFYLVAEFTGLSVSENAALQTGAGFTLIYNQA